MKFTLLAAIATYALAYDPQDIPDGLSAEDVTLRWNDETGKKVGDEAMDRAALKEELKAIDNKAGRKACMKGVRQFDAYCHQYRINEQKLARGKIPKYADFTVDGSCDAYAPEEDEDGEQIHTLEQLACLGQDCMFDYCIWRRDQYLEACVAANGDLERDAWGDVYNFGEMHGDLASNGGEWANATCDAYYEVKEVLENDGTFDEAGY